MCQHTFCQSKCQDTTPKHFCKITFFFIIQTAIQSLYLHNPKVYKVLQDWPQLPTIFSYVPSIKLYGNHNFEISVSFTFLYEFHILLYPLDWLWLFDSNFCKGFSCKRVQSKLKQFLITEQKWFLFTFKQTITREGIKALILQYSAS